MVSEEIVMCLEAQRSALTASPTPAFSLADSLVADSLVYEE